MKKLNLPVEFGNVSITCQSSERATLPVKVAHEEIELERAFELFVGKMLTATITTDDSLENQKKLKGMEDESRPFVEAVFESSKMTANPNTVAASLAFSVRGVDRDILARLEKRKGRLVVTMVEESNGKLSDDVDEDDDVMMTLEDDEHPDVATGKDRPHGTPLLEAAAKAHGSKGKQKATFENKAWAVSKHEELGELDADYLLPKHLHDLGCPKSVKGLTAAKIKSLKAALGDGIDEIAHALSKNKLAWGDAKRWTDSDGKKLVEAIEALYKHVVSTSGKTAFE